MLPLIWKGWMRPAGQLARQTDMFCFNLESCFVGKVVEFKKEEVDIKRNKNQVLLTLSRLPGPLLGVKVAKAAPPVSPLGSPPRLLLLRRGRGASARDGLPFGMGMTLGKGSSFWSLIVVRSSCDCV